MKKGDPINYEKIIDLAINLLKWDTFEQNPEIVLASIYEKLKGLICEKFQYSELQYLAACDAMKWVNSIAPVATCHA